MHFKTSRLAVFIVAVAFSVASGQQPTSSPSKSAAEVASLFLHRVESKEVDDALKLWDAKAVNAALKARLEKMSAKVAGFGGIKKVDIGTCEERRMKQHEQKTGEKIDVVPVEIICGNDTLLLAVFSIRQVENQPRIFMLESLKEWGGTASLDEELPYQH